MTAGDLVTSQPLVSYMLSINATLISTSDSGIPGNQSRAMSHAYVERVTLFAGTKHDHLSNMVSIEG